MRIVVVASGGFADGDERWIGAGSLVIAADGGANWLTGLGRMPDRLVGDLDSIEPAVLRRVEEAAVPIERHSPDKEASDLELAVDAAVDAGAAEIIILGGMGGPRADHGLANVLLLADPSLAGTPIQLVHGSTSIRPAHEGRSLELGAARGDLVTLLPVAGDARGVTTRGLRWPLAGAVLRLGRSRGLSNVVDDAPASVSLEAGTLLVVEHRNEPEGASP